MSRVLKVVAVLFLAVVWSAAAAQSAEGDQAANVYDLFQGPANVGEFGATFTPVDPEAAGAGVDLSGVSDSYATVPGFLDFDASLTVGPDGSADSYRLTGTVQGVAVEIEAAFHVGGVTITATQAGQTSSFELAAREPLYVVDNNFIDGLQLIARRAVASPGVEVDIAIVVPQVVQLGRATAIANHDVEDLEHAGTTLSTRRVEVEMLVAGQSVASTLWLDEAGDIVVLEQPAFSVRFVRRGDQAAGGSGGESVGAEVSEGAQAFLDRTRQCVEATDVTVQSTGETLAGVLTLPVAQGAEQQQAPTLLVLPGSGAVDIAGNALPIIRNSALEQLAYGLGCHGYGVLRIAKLGIPPSTGDGNAVTLDTYAQNTADWLALLASHPGVDPTRIGLIGHSEGGLVAVYAAAGHVIDPASLVLIAAPGRPLGVLLEEQLLARAAESGATDAELAELGQQVTQALAAIRASSGTRLDLTGDLAQNPIAQMFGHAAGLLRTEMGQDPAALLASLELPVLIVQGAKDMQVRSADGDALAAAAPRARLVTIPDLTHNLVDYAGPALEGMVPSPDAVLSADLLATLTTFLAEHLGTTTP